MAGDRPQGDAPATSGTVFSEAMGLLRRLLGTQTLSVLVFGLLCVWAYRAFASDAGVMADEKVQPVKARVEAVETRLNAHELASAQAHAVQTKELSDVKASVGQVERRTQEIDLNVRLLLEARGLRPITLEPPTDGGR